MKKYLSFIIVCFFLVLSNLVYAQFRLKGICLDRDTKQVIPYATIHVIQSALWTDADQNGYFEVDIQNQDSIYISCVGYLSITRPINEAQHLDTFFLQSVVVSLPEIFIGERKILSLGQLKAKKTFDMNSKSSTRVEIATRINIPSHVKDFQLKKINIAGINFNPTNPVRIHVYNVGSLGQPDKELLTKDIVISSNNSSKSVLELDVTGQNIFLSGNFFISVQWISDSNNQNRINPAKRTIIGPGILCTYSNKNTITYMRDKAAKFGYKWALVTDGIIYPYDYKIPEKLPNSPLNMLLSCDILY